VGLEENELSRVKDAFNSYLSAKKRAEETLPSQNSEFDALCLHFHEKEPTKEDIATLLKATEDYDNAEANLLVEEDLLSRQRHPSKKTIFSTITGALCIALGALAMILSWFLLGGIACGTGAVLLLLPLLLRAPSTKHTRGAELQRAHAVLSSLLLPYHYTEKNPSLSSKLLFKDIARFRALRAENERRAAWMFVSPDKSEALFTLVTTRSVFRLPLIIKFRGLDPDAMYHITETDETLSGAALMNAGYWFIDVPMADKESYTLHLERA